MLDHVQTRRQILFDITATYLQPLGGLFSRLAYLAGLKNSSTGRYAHERLAAVYAADTIHEVIGQCHEEVLERLLEMSLAAQEKDLSMYLSSLPGYFDDNVRSCRTIAVLWIPAGAPSYLRELFCSNLNVLTEILLNGSSRARSDK
jgi:hypothetical protein